MQGMSQAQIWAAIDALAAWRGLSTSGLAKLAGLDPTAFNRSKRQSADGRPRWLSTESLAKVLEATGTTLDDFIRLMRGETLPLERKGLEHEEQGRAPALLKIAAPETAALRPIADFRPFGALVEAPCALAVHGNALLPLYRDGDILIVDPATRLRPGDRVVVGTRNGELSASTLTRSDASGVALSPFDPAQADRVLPAGEIEWMARILWVSQ
jgi:phage repressor protein C with HTH and peptisase S24 domain